MREWLIYYIENSKPMNKTVSGVDIFTALLTAAVPYYLIKSIKEVSQ